MIETGIQTNVVLAVLSHAKRDRYSIDIGPLLTPEG
jgi:hypothetical protein